MEQDRARATQGKVHPALATYLAARKDGIAHGIAPGDPRLTKRIIHAQAQPKRNSKASEGQRGQSTSGNLGDKIRRKEIKPAKNFSLLSAEIKSRPQPLRPATPPPPPPPRQRRRETLVTPTSPASTVVSPINTIIKRDPDKHITVASTYEAKPTKPVTRKPTALSIASGSKGEQSQSSPNKDTKTEELNKPGYPPTMSLSRKFDLDWITVSNDTNIEGAKKLLRYIKDNNLGVHLSMTDASTADSLDRYALGMDIVQQYQKDKEESQVKFLCKIGDKPVYCNNQEATKAYLRTLNMKKRKRSLARELQTPNPPELFPTLTW